MNIQWHPPGHIPVHDALPHLLGHRRIARRGSSHDCDGRLFRIVVCAQNLRSFFARHVKIA
eukprot:6458392-Pyramimonas_sp.AAC.1